MTQPTLIYSQPVMRPPNPFGPVPGAQVCIFKIPNSKGTNYSWVSFFKGISVSRVGQMHCTSMLVHVRIESSVQGDGIKFVLQKAGDVLRHCSSGSMTEVFLCLQYSKDIQ